MKLFGMTLRWMYNDSVTNINASFEHILKLFKRATIRRRLLFLFGMFGILGLDFLFWQLNEDLSLLCCQVSWDFDPNSAHVVASFQHSLFDTLNNRHLYFSFYDDFFSILQPSSNRNVLLSPNCFNTLPGSKCCLGNCDPFRCFDVSFWLSEPLMFFYVNFDMQISAWSAFALISLNYFLLTFYGNVIFSPLETPAGIYTSSSTLLTLMPVALQSLHGHLITNPIPLHLVHSKCITTEFCRKTVEPEPPQAKHLVGAVPGSHRFPLHVLHVSLRSNEIFALAPFAASMKFTVTSLDMSSPLLLRVEPVEYVSW